LFILYNNINLLCNNNKNISGGSCPAGKKDLNGKCINTCPFYATDGGTVCTDTSLAALGSIVNIYII
jgi:hypothetical protein